MKPRHFIVSILVMLLVSWLTGAVRGETINVGTLVLEIPARFKAEVLHKKAGPEGELDFNEWRTEDGRILQVLYYFKYTSWDGGGPMKIAKEDAMDVAGQKTKLIETEWFLG
ncbi:MAG TPA: hypothetical protein VK961_24405, partial [Chthoniobacter sp.]|nr:hypothetical protein [Chthoniobacter sp.]